MIKLDELEVLGRAQLPIKLFEQLRNECTKLDQLIYVGVDGQDMHCYLRPDGSIIRLTQRIES